MKRLTEEAVASGVQNTALSFHSGISSDSVKLRSQQNLVAFSPEFERGFLL